MKPSVSGSAEMAWVLGRQMATTKTGQLFRVLIERAPHACTTRALQVNPLLNLD